MILGDDVGGGCIGVGDEPAGVDVVEAVDVVGAVESVVEGVGGLSDVDGIVACVGEVVGEVGIECGDGAVCAELSGGGVVV